MKLALAVVLLAAAAPRLAHAECAIPHWVGTPPQTRLPTHGSLYIYDPYAETVEAKWVGMPATTHTTRISPTVLRYDYEATLPATVDLGRDWDPQPFRFDARWKPPATPPRVLQYWHHLYAWTCSNADSVMFQIDQPTAAFRVSWTFGGLTTHFIIPAVTDDDNRSVVELGKLNCAGDNIDPEELKIGGALALTAIRFDGSEVPVTGLPKVVTTMQMAVDDGHRTGRAFHLGLLPEDEPEPVAVVKEPETNFVGGFAVISCLFGALIGIRAGKRTPPTEV